MEQLLQTLEPDSFGIFHLDLPDVNNNGKRKKRLVSISTGYKSAATQTASLEQVLALLWTNPDYRLNYKHPKEHPLRLALIDIDDCFTAEGTLKPDIMRLVKFMNSYTELSASGTGLHILAWIDEEPPITNQATRMHKHEQSGVEMYWSNSPILITGDFFCTSDWTPPEPIQSRTNEFHRVHKLLFPDAYTEPKPVAKATNAESTLTEAEVLERMFGEQKNGHKWKDLWNGLWMLHGYSSPSGADLAILQKLRYWCSGDVAMVERIFRQSPLFNLKDRGTDGKRKCPTPKWDRYQGYGDKTLRKMIETGGAVYTPVKKTNDRHDEFLAQYKRMQANAKKKGSR